MVQKRFTISTKINERENLELNKLAERENISISAISNEDFEENLRYKELRLDKLVSVFEENNYPDWFIRQQMEIMISQIRDVESSIREEVIQIVGAK